MDQYRPTASAACVHDGIKTTDWYMQTERLHWAAHVVRMLDNRIPQRVLEGSLGGRPAGRPRNRWEDDVRNDGAKLLYTKKTGTQRQDVGVN